MLHAAPTALRWLAEAASGGSDNGTKIALIGAVAVVLAAAIPALLSLRERMPKELEQLQQINREDRARLEAEITDTEDSRRAAEDKLHDLERFVWQLGYDPETHQRIAREEPDGGEPAQH